MDGALEEGGGLQNSRRRVILFGLRRPGQAMMTAPAGGLLRVLLLLGLLWVGTGHRAILFSTLNSAASPDSSPDSGLLSPIPDFNPPKKPGPAKEPAGRRTAGQASKLRADPVPDTKLPSVAASHFSTLSKASQGVLAFDSASSTALGSSTASLLSQDSSATLVNHVAVIVPRTLGAFRDRPIPTVPSRPRDDSGALRNQAGGRDLDPSLVDGHEARDHVRGMWSQALDRIPWIALGGSAIPLSPRGAKGLDVLGIGGRGQVALESSGGEQAGSTIGKAGAVPSELRELEKEVYRLNSALTLSELTPLTEKLLDGVSTERRFPANISSMYKGTWVLSDPNTTQHFPDLHRTSGNIIFQLTSVSTSRAEVHYVHGEVVLRDGMYIGDGDVHMRLEGVYVRPFGQLRMVLSSSNARSSASSHSEQDSSRPARSTGSGAGQDGDEEGDESVEGGLRGGGGAPYTFGVQRGIQGRRRFSGEANVLELAKNCKIRMTTQLAELPPEAPPAGSASLNPGHDGGTSSSSGGGSRDSGSPEQAPVTVMWGLVESPREEDGSGDCFAPLVINATAVDLEAYYNKAVNYTLMVTLLSFLQVLFIIRQMEYSNTQSGAAKVSLLMVGQQAIMDAYLCLLHLTAGIVVESLFNAFATAAFFKFVIFSIFEMRYLLAIWKAQRAPSFGEGWDTMRRELSILYSRFYGFLLGGILLMYQLHSLLKVILLIFYSFWIPQIVSNVIKDNRRPLHPHYILGMSITRLAIPLYTFGCPHNFMRVEPDPRWCIALASLMAVQAGVLLLQHYFGSRCFIPRAFLPRKYSYSRRFVPPIGSVEEGGTLDCVICMAPVDVMGRPTQRMVTPCDHVFHAGCLQRWMDIKMECPTCRRVLPPL